MSNIIPMNHRTDSEIQDLLAGCWVVLIMDPDWDNTSPWSVTAKDIDEAVTKAVEGWTALQTDPDDPEPVELEKPHIVKVYRNSWIGEIEWGERYPGGLGTYDMSKLANYSR